MQIYDRNNRVPRAVSSQMEFMISGTWFAYIMVVALDWLPDLLYDTYRIHDFPILFLFDDGVYGVVQRFSFAQRKPTKIGDPADRERDHDAFVVGGHVEFDGARMQPLTGALQIAPIAPHSQRYRLPCYISPR